MIHTVGNRVKTAVEEKQIQDRLQYQPEVLEFHLVEQDLYGERKKKLQEAIEFVQSFGTKVYLHHPMKTGSHYLDIISYHPEVRSFYEESCRILHELCETYNIRCVLHCNYATSDKSIDIHTKNTTEVKKEIQNILSFSKQSFLWEDSITGVFSYKNPDLIEQVIKPLQLPLIQDISHSFIALEGDNERLLDVTSQISSYVQYLHVVDSMGKHHDSLVLGKGNIDWHTIKPFTVGKDFIFEINCENMLDCSPMIQSASFYNNI